MFLWTVGSGKAICFESQFNFLDVKINITLVLILYVMVNSLLFVFKKKQKINLLHTFQIHLFDAPLTAICTPEFLWIPLSHPAHLDY